MATDGNNDHGHTDEGHRHNGSSCERRHNTDAHRHIDDDVNHHNEDTSDMGKRYAGNNTPPRT